MEKQGYMQSPNDWKNIEMTGQVKFVSGDSSDSGPGTLEVEDILAAGIQTAVKAQRTRLIYFTVVDKFDGLKNNGMFTIYSQAPSHRQQVVTESTWDLRLCFTI